MKTKYREIKNVKKNNEIKAIFIYAFYYYTHPLKKVSLVKKGLLLIDKLIKNVIKDPVVAADDYTPIYIQALCDINPYGIKSNWEFFNKYVIGVLDDFDYRRLGVLEFLIKEYEDFEAKNPK